MLTYKKTFIKKHSTICPVCKRHYFTKPNAYEICPICNWEDDPIQRKDRDFKGGANKLSLNETILNNEKSH